MPETNRIRCLCSKINYQQTSVNYQLVVGITATGDQAMLAWKCNSPSVAPMSSAVMAQILDSLPPEHASHLVCCYVNATSKIQIARISNIPNWYYERVVFPGQRLVFQAPPHSLLEIHTGMMASAILSDHIPCERLCLLEESPSADISQQAASKATDHNNSQNSINLTAAVLTTVD